MKKEYMQPEVEIIEMNKEDVMTTSTKISYDPLGLFESNADTWNW